MNYVLYFMCQLQTHNTCKQSKCGIKNYYIHRLKIHFTSQGQNYVLPNYQFSRVCRISNLKYTKFEIKFQIEIKYVEISLEIL